MLLESFLLRWVNYMDHKTKKPTHHTKPEHHDKVIVWSSPEFEHHSKNHFWFIGIGVLVIAFFIAAARYGEYLLGLVAIAFGLAAGKLAQDKPSHHDIKVSRDGVDWGKKKIALTDIKSFWLSAKDEEITLYLELASNEPILQFHLPEEKAEAVTDLLAEYLPFHDHRDEPILDKFNRWLRI